MSNSVKKGYNAFLVRNEIYYSSPSYQGKGDTPEGNSSPDQK